MPYSLVFHIIPQSNIPPGYLTGRHLHALFLTIVDTVDHELANSLHKSQADKAFTLSVIQVGDTHRYDRRKYKVLQWQHERPIREGIACWWRVSLLDEQLFHKLTKLWLNLNPAHPWHLGPADLLIPEIWGTSQVQQPWANTMTYQQLYEEADEGNREINFCFATPTCFRQGKFDSALPTKDNVFNSLLSKWRKYSGMEFADLNFEAVHASYFDIHTEAVLEERNRLIGCVGEVNYRILGDVDPVIIKQINTLADFAMYCGVGRKTPMGMGMVRRL
jgi:CRISPR-associated endoribonuclease Cas6